MSRKNRTKILWGLLLGFGLGGVGCTPSPLEQAEEYLEAHDLASAEQQYREVLRKDPRDVKALAGLGWTYHLALERESALRQFSYCLGVDPQNVACLRGQASVALAQDELLQARLLIDQALELAPTDPEVLLTESLLLLSKGEVSKARVQLEQLVQRMPEKGAYRLPYAEALLREDKVKEALEQTEIGLQQTIPRRTQSMFWVLRARLLLIQSSVAGEDCSQIDVIVPWVDEAERSLERATQTGVDVPNVGIVRRQLQRRRTTLQAKCHSNKGL